MSETEEIEEWGRSGVIAIGKNKSGEVLIKIPEGMEEGEYIAFLPSQAFDFAGAIIRVAQGIMQESNQ